MQTSEIMIINRLDTNTAFGATVEGNQAVFDQPPQPKVQDDLVMMILADLSESGSATVEEVAKSISQPLLSVIAKMQEMARGGTIKQRTFYAIDEDDFYDGGE